MSLSINNQPNVNYQRNNKSPNFGMAVKLDKSAIPVIKEQIKNAPSLNKKMSFIADIKRTLAAQKENPVNIIIRKTKGRNALAAEVIDSKHSPELGIAKNKVFSQPFLFKNADSKFLQRAETEANNLNNFNNELKGLVNEIPAAGPSDYTKPHHPKNVIAIIDNLNEFHS